MTKEISVIIPTYNRAKYLADCINSVLNQKGNFDLDVIVVDDGSTDNTQDILKQFKGKIRCKKTNNSARPAVPRNIGLRMAKSDLVAFQDSDDLWVPDKLISQVKVFDDPGIVLSYGNTEIMDKDGKKTGKTVITNDQASSGNIFTDLTKVNFISTLTVMARKSTLKQAGFFNESVKFRGIEDYEFWLRVSLLGKVKFVDKVLAYYRHHDQNISTGSAYLDAKKILEIMKSLEKRHLNNDQKRAVRQKEQTTYAELQILSKFPEAQYWLLRRAQSKLLR